jgi:plasmid maintenance system killer protein
VEKTEKLMNALSKIIDALSNSDETSLGFSDFTGDRWIYIGDDDSSDTPWYFFINNEKLFISQSCLTGFLTGIEVMSREFKGKTNRKLLVKIKADQSYVIQVGLKTVFAKGLLLGLEKFTQEYDFKSIPVSIVAKKGDSENVNFCSIFVNEQFIKVSYPSIDDWDPSVAVDSITNNLIGDQSKKKELLRRIKAAQITLNWDKDQLRNYAFDKFKQSNSDNLSLKELDAMAYQLEMINKVQQQDKEI